MSHLESVTLTQLDQQMAIYEMQANHDETLAEAKKAKAYQNGINKADETIQMLAKKLGDMQKALDQERARHQEAEKLSGATITSLENQIKTLQAENSTLKDRVSVVEEENSYLKQGRLILSKALHIVAAVFVGDDRWWGVPYTDPGFMAGGQAGQHMDGNAYAAMFNEIRATGHLFNPFDPTNQT